MALKTCNVCQLLAVLLLGAVTSTHGMTQGEKQKSYEVAIKAMERSRSASEGFHSRRKLQQYGTYVSNKNKDGTKSTSGLYLYTPINSTYLDGDDFANFFYDNYNNNSSPGIALSTGSYTVNTATNYKTWVLTFECNANINRPTPFKVDLGGSVLYVGNMNLAGIGWDQCSNVTFTSASITYALNQQVFTQGTILDIQNANWTFQVDYGYPSDPSYSIFQNSHTGVFYDGFGHIKQNSSDWSIGPFTSIGAGTYTVPNGAGPPGFYNGIRTVLRGDTGATHMHFCNVCNNFRMVNVNVWSSNVFGVFEATCYNSTYTGVQVVPDPTPRNRPPPLFASNADGIHSVFPSYGPQITNCTVQNTGDDNIAVHGAYYVVGAINTTGPGPNNITFGSWNCGSPSCLTTLVGSQLQLYTTSFQDLGSATITSIANTAQPQNVTGPSYYFPAFDYDYATYFVATVASWPANWTTAAVGGIVTNPQTSGLYSNISNNTIGNNRARGIYFKGQSSVIASNNVTGSSSVGIFLAPDFYFLESGWNYNVSITKNYVNVTTSGIVMSATNLSLQAPIYQNHKAVTFSQNVIQGAVHPLLIGSASAVTATNNSIIDGCCYPYSWGDLFSNQGGNQGQLVYTSYTTNSAFRGNTFATNNSNCQYYGNYGSPYSLGPGSSNIVTQ